MKHFNYIFLIGLAAVWSCNAPSNENSEDSSEGADSIVIETDMQESNIVGEEVSYSADGVEMKGYMTYDANITDPVPGVLVVHEWWGHNEHARNKAEDLAKLGYVALAVDMYGDGKQAEHPEDAGKFSGMVMSNIEGSKARFESAYNLLQSSPKTQDDKMAAIGFCFGGSVVLTMANMGMDLDAVTAFHSGVALPVMPGENLKANVLVFNGADDPFIPAESVTAFKEAMDATGATYEYVNFPGAVHAFTNPGADEMGAKFELPLSYNAAADSASWKAMKAQFETAL